MYNHIILVLEVREAHNYRQLFVIMLLVPDMLDK